MTPAEELAAQIQQDERDAQRWRHIRDHVLRLDTRGNHPEGTTAGDVTRIGDDDASGPTRFSDDPNRTWRDVAAWTERCLSAGSAPALIAQQLRSYLAEEG